MTAPDPAREYAAVLIERLCEVMHDAYEAAATIEGWETQERSRKPWADVPEANKATMRAAVRALLASPAHAAVIAAAKAEAYDRAHGDICEHTSCWGGCYAGHENPYRAEQVTP